jgi:TonB family protein
MRAALVLAAVSLATQRARGQGRPPGTWADSIQTPAFRIDVVGTDKRVVVITIRTPARVAELTVADTDARIFSDSARAFMNRPLGTDSYVLSRARLRFEYVATGNARDMLHFGFLGDSGIDVQGGYADVGRAIGSVGAAAIWSAGMTRLIQTGSSAPASNGTGLPSETYFAFQTTKPVVPKPGNVAPRYPDSLRVAGVEGEVLAQFVVDTAGHVDMSFFRALKSTHPIFTQAVKDVLLNFEFTPAEIGGRKVRQLVQMPFQFNITPVSRSIRPPKV